jgi:hypothetical protein
MLSITRRQARGLRPIFRRATFAISHRGPAPPVVFDNDGSQLVARCAHAGLAVEHLLGSIQAPRESIALPLDALADFEGRDDSIVTLELNPDGRIIAHWTDHGIPVTRDYVAFDPATIADFPARPERIGPCSRALVDAIAEAQQVAGEDSARYALGSIQLRGVAGEVVATDGRQLLIRSGFRFPWPDDLLVAASPIFAAKGLSFDPDATLGRTATHVVFASGPSTIAIAIRAGVRFPAVAAILPEPSRIATRLDLDPADASFLADTLDHLPGIDAINAPVTIDLNGKVCVRASDAEGRHLTELILARSAYTGPPIRLVSDRRLLAHAARLGAIAIGLAGTDRPIVARGEDRIYAWQPLSEDAALAPALDAIRVESTSIHALPDRSPARATIPVDIAHPRLEPSVTTADPRSGLAALIQEAESLHATLADAKARSHRLIAALRRHRKQSRLVQDTLKSLRQLNLQDVAG